ncbi:MAG: hypothetical protein CMO80_13555 [Verrucomicrobiales bacterium]|nr:hypothetical protein [Verrucomicrobiales bacterium]
MRTHFQRRSQLAFTLIEVLIAIAILGLVMSSIYSIWAAMLRATRTGNDAADRIQRERLARQTIETALGSVQFYQANMDYYAFVADTENEDFTFLSFVSHLPESFPGSGLFPGFPLRRVTFEVVEEGSNGMPQLNMEQRLLLSDTNEIEESYTIALVTNVGLFNLEFWDTNEQEWIIEWTATNHLPPMARLVMGYDGEKENDLFTSVIRLSSQPVPMAMQSASGGP